MAYRGRQQEQTSGRFLRSGDNAAEYQSTCSDVKERKLAEERATRERGPVPGHV